MMIVIIIKNLLFKKGKDTLPSRTKCPQQNRA